MMVHGIMSWSRLQILSNWMQLLDIATELASVNCLVLQLLHSVECIKSCFSSFVFWLMHSSVSAHVPVFLEGDRKSLLSYIISTIN